MKKLLLLFMIYKFLRPVHSVNGVIWNKKIEDFVPIFSDPHFAEMNQEVFRRSREQETHNFQGKVVRLTYYEHMNILTSYANGTKVTGAIGEIWNILSESLNFTLVPIVSKHQTLGIVFPTGKYTDGLLKIIHANETDVIPRVEADNERRRAVQFTMPIWKTKLRFYIRREEQCIFDWMLKLFSQKLWYAILWMYLLFSVCSYVSQMIGAALSRQKLSVKLNEHMFYNFGVICGQTYLPKRLSKSSNVVELWLSIFSFLIRTAFNALILCYMTQTVTKPPFFNVHSLVTSTSYHVIALSGSLPDILLKTEHHPDTPTLFNTNRYTALKTTEQLYRTACSTDKLFCMVQNDDLKKAAGMYICPLNPVGKSIFTPIIVAGIARNFEYKRTIDIGIIKLHELGLLSLLKQRWIDSMNVEEEHKNGADPIDMEEVYLILCIFGGGSLIAFLILILENLTFYCNN